MTNALLTLIGLTIGIAESLYCYLEEKLSNKIKEA